MKRASIRRLGPGSALALFLAANPAAGQSFVDQTAAAGLGDYAAFADDGHAPGAVFADLDNDTYPDLYLIGRDPADAPGLYNRVYVNRPGPDGQRVFEPLPPRDAGRLRRSNGAVAGDYDNDGDLDLYVLAFGPNTLLRNQLAETGKLAFVDVTATTDPTPGVDDDQLGVGRARARGCDGRIRGTNKSLTAAWADPDRDGDLDLYVGTHNGFVSAFDENGDFGFDPERPPVQTDDPLPGSRDTFYRNDGVGADGRVTFTDVTTSLTPTAGLTGFETAAGEVETVFQCYGSSNAAIFADLNRDLWPDLVVTNKTASPDDRDMLYLNRGADAEGAWLGFEAASYTVAATCYGLQTPPLIPPEGTQGCFGFMSPAAMGVDVGDPDNDGDFDLYVTDISGDPAALPEPYSLLLGNDLWVNQLAQEGELAFVYDGAMPGRTSWGAQWQDFDNDGDEDLHVTSSFPDYFFANRWSASGRFAERSQVHGIANPGDGRGNPTADVDRDGWIDVLVVNRNTAADEVPVRSILWRNGPRPGQRKRHHLSVKLIGDPSAGAGPWRSSRDALGARVEVQADLDGDGEVSAREVQTREVRSGSSNAASTSSLELEVGLWRARSARLVVHWPSGKMSAFEVAADRYLWISEAGDEVVRDLAVP